MTAEYTDKCDVLEKKGSIETVHFILSQNPHIQMVNFWNYCYVPLMTNESNSRSFWETRTNILCRPTVDFVHQDERDKFQTGIGSKVFLSSGETAQIPMMDFQIAKSNENLELLRKRLNHVGIESGWILETGESYHFYGNTLIHTQEEWMDFIGKCLLASIVNSRDNIQQIADSRYIGHSLRRGCCVLRLTSHGDKTYSPKVVARI